MAADAGHKPEIRKFQLGKYNNNCYVLVCPKTKESILIDASADASIILKQLEGTKVKQIFLTHGHADHIDALEPVKAALKVPVGIHPGDAERLSSPPDYTFGDGDTVTFGDHSAKVIHTPGHTKGSVCLLVDGTLIAGDTLFNGGPGKTGAAADLTAILETIRTKLMTLPDETVVHPGHGDSTTIGAQRPGFEAYLRQPRDPNYFGDVSWADLAK
ncbi:MAG: MBL fold metallo-hydrolase [Chloroflexi bacterium]|nr:MBL fold metallo-hydrolase [Chloroflexota bacterium]